MEIINKFVIFCTDHFNPLGVIRSLGEVGIRPDVIILAKKSILVKYSKYIDTFHIVSTLPEGLALIESKYLNELLPPFILFTSDNIASFIDSNFEKLRRKAYFYNCASQGKMTALMEKNKISAIAESLGFQIPKTVRVKRWELNHGLTYPIITKSATSTIDNWKSNVYICNNAEELQSAYTLIIQDEVVLQEYVHKVDELNVEGYSINDGKDVYMPLCNRFFRTTDKSYGNYFYIKQFDNLLLREKIHKLLREISFNGIFEIEFLVAENGDLFFLEINLRNSAWIYAYTSCGVNLPYLYAQAVLAGQVIEAKDIKRLPFKAIDEITDFKWSVIGGKVNLFRWIVQLFKSDCHFYYNRNDQKPFWLYLFNRFKKVIGL